MIDAWSKIVGQGGFRFTKSISKQESRPIVPGSLDSNSPLILYCIPVFLIHCPSARSEKIRAERGKIQYDHDESKEIQTHCQSNGDMHCQNTNQPEKSSLFIQIKNG